MTDRLDLLLVNPGGRERIYQDLGGTLTAVEPPLWCRLIGGYVRDRGHSVAILDSEAENRGPRQVAESVCAQAPRLVVMVVFGHQPSASTQQMIAAGEACAAIKAVSSETPILIVGGHVSALPERTLAEEAVDFACKGEGPVTALRLLEVLKAGSEFAAFDTIPGLVWRKNGKITINAPAPLISDLDADLHGQVWDLLPMTRYRAHNWQCFGDLSTRQPYASIYTSLGCPYRCVFCCINAPFDANRYRMRSPAAVVAEIARLHADYGVKTFKIIDEMFVLNERHVTAICDGLIERDLDLNLWAYARVDTVKPRMLDRLRRAGFRWLALGIESGSTLVRDGAQKSLRQDDIIAIVREIQKAGINVIGNYIFGLPDDDETSMNETLALAKELNCEFANFYSAMAYPGSNLYGMALERGWALPEAWSGFSQHSYDCQPLPTEKVTAATVLGFRDAAFHDHFTSPRYLDMVTRRFGWDTRQHIEAMSRTRLRRRLLETANPAESPCSGLAGIDVAMLAGGLGTRIQGVLGSVPKVLAPIHGRPFLEHAIDWLTGFGVRRLVLCLGHRADAVIDHLAGRAVKAVDGGALELVTMVEPAPLGTKGALAFARAALTSDPVFVLNGDSFVEADLAGFVARHRASGAGVSILCAEVADAERYGRIETTATGFVARFVEKDPEHRGPGLISVGLYLISAALLDRLLTLPGASLERDFLQILPPGTIRAEVTTGAFIDIGTPQSLAAAPSVVPDIREQPR